MSVTRGIAAALSAPLFEAVGFLEFERHWRDGRGSAFSLNLFKCNVSSVGFLFMIWLERMGSMGNLPSPNPFSALYLEHEPPKFYESMERQRGPFLRKTQGSTTNQKRNDFVPILLDLTQQKFTEEEHTQPFNNLHNNNQPESPRLENRPNQGYPAQNVIVVGQGDSMHNTASQIGYSELHHPYVEGNTPQSNRFYSMNTKAIQQYAPGLELRSENEYFQDHVHERGPTQDQAQYRFHQSNQPKPVSLEQVFEQQKTSTMVPIPILTQGLHYLSPKRDGAFTVVTVAHLVLSSLLGIFIGDCCELEALRLIGARRVLLMASMKPFAAAFFAHWFLQEDLHAAAWLGMALTIIGVLLVVQQSMENLSSSTKKQDWVRKNKQMSNKKINILDSSFNAKISGGKNSDVPQATDKVDNISRQDVDAMCFSTIWESNGFSYISSKPFRHKSLSRFDALSDISSDEESFDSAVDDHLFGLYDDFDEEVHDLFGEGELLELTNIKHCQVKQMRSNSATSLGSFGSMKKFVGVEDMIPEDNNSTLVSEKYKSKDDTGVMSNDGFTNAVDLKPLPLDDAEPLSANNAVSNPESTILESLFLSHDQIAEKDAHEFHHEYHSDDEANVNKFPGGKRIRLRSSHSFGSVKSLNSECGPPPGSKRENSKTRLQRIRQGYLLALCNVCLDAYGFVLTKQYGVDMTTWEINFIRYGFAGFILLLVSFFLRARDLFCTLPDHAYMSFKRGFDAKQHLHKRSPMKSYSNSGIVETFPSWYRLPNLSWHSWSVVFVGVIFVSFLCPALQGYALFRLPFSSAITLNSVTPLYAIPLMWLFKNQKPLKRGCFGAVIAVTGVMVLCIWGYD
jgi:drug/metabolite transporter (DMT)-like permease